MGTIDTQEVMEQIPSAPVAPQASSRIMSLAKAIELGEYDPAYLSQFEEWGRLSRHSQFELIRQALKNRTSQLALQWSEINNILDFSKKPHLKEALHNIEKQREKVLRDQDKLYLEYSKI